MSTMRTVGSIGGAGPLEGDQRERGRQVQQIAQDAIGHDDLERGNYPAEISHEHLGPVIGQHTVEHEDGSMTHHYHHQGGGFSSHHVVSPSGRGHGGPGPTGAVHGRENAVPPHGPNPDDQREHGGRVGRKHHGGGAGGE